MDLNPARIEIVGDSLAIKWENGKESFWDATYLRLHSPSAENKGETDIFGNVSGGNKQTKQTKVSILNFLHIGNYAIRIIFSDGHSTGIFSWKYLREIEKE